MDAQSTTTGDGIGVTIGDTAMSDLMFNYVFDGVDVDDIVAITEAAQKFADTICLRDGEAEAGRIPWVHQAVAEFLGRV